MRFYVKRAEWQQGQSYGPNAIARFENEGDALLFMKAMRDYDEQQNANARVRYLLYTNRSVKHVEETAMQRRASWNSTVMPV